MHGSYDTPTLDQAGRWGEVISPAWVLAGTDQGGVGLTPLTRADHVVYKSKSPKAESGVLLVLCQKTFSATFVLIQI